MRYLIPLSIFILIVLASYTIKPIERTLTVDEETSVATLLKELGDKTPNHLVDESVKGASIEIGEAIVKDGFSMVNGKKGKRQSKHFVCTSCHNIKREDPFLTQNDDPEARLMYAQKNDLPLLQGTTLWGAVNRETFYNGDYEKKYGELVKPTRHNLREAIQLCATECSQGRRLDEIELESVLKYLWTLELKIKDLGWDKAAWDKFNGAYASGTNKEDLIHWIKQQYALASPATFLNAPQKETIETLKGDPKNGELVYEKACLHCHAKKRYSFFHLDKKVTTMNFLSKYFHANNHFDAAYIARTGTKPKPWKRTYMPNFTKERLSNQQLADLKAYFKE